VTIAGRYVSQAKRLLEEIAMIGRP